jgi:hypothetical protein
MYGKKVLLNATIIFLGFGCKKSVLSIAGDGKEIKESEAEERERNVTNN